MKRVAIYWICNVTKMYELLFQTGMMAKAPLTVNGEMYMDVTDEQFKVLDDYRQRGFCEFRNKLLVKENGKLYPAKAEITLTNK